MLSICAKNSISEFNIFRRFKRIEDVKNIFVGKQEKISLKNRVGSVTIDLLGGAITNFSLRIDKINPLSFKFSRSQMPLINLNGPPYQGHFICLGRWGKPSLGEINAGIPEHGEFANIPWKLNEHSQYLIDMEADGKLEGLKVNRRIEIDKKELVFHTKEIITNILSLGRLYNIVQHPTIAHPFLNANTRIFCNANKGFYFKNFEHPEKHAAKWPMGKVNSHSVSNLSY